MFQTHTSACYPHRAIRLAVVLRLTMFDVMSSLLRRTPVTIPLRYLSIYQGEQFIDVAHLLYSVMNEIPSNQVFHITYDIGCHLEPYFHTCYPDFHNRMVFMINTFHAYAHEMKCQVQFGPKYTEDCSETDREGPMLHRST